MKDFLILFLAQVTFCALVVASIRAIGAGDVFYTELVEGLLASLNFIIMRKVARLVTENSGFLGYFLGSLVGTGLGLYVAKGIL